MTKPWVSDGRHRASKKYREMHDQLAEEIMMEQRAKPETHRRRKAGPASPAQMSLFDTVEQPRRPKPEPLALFRAVVMLRKRGKAVYRAGRHDHLVDGKTMTDAQLAAMAGQMVGPA